MLRSIQLENFKAFGQRRCQIVDEEEDHAPFHPA
jgi:hypothetical protein